jgi:carboxylesterase type B
MLSFYSLSFLPLILGSPITKRAEPSITIQNGTIIGNTILGIDSFKGIPYAAPPVGDLRLRPPQPIASSFGTFESQLLPAACPQFWSSLEGSNLPEDVAGLLSNSPIFKAASLKSEDCLTLNVQRPAGTSSDAKLPVMVWIFGGAFAIGGTQLYDGTRIVAQSIGLGEPVIFVAINYRLGGFGFLPGKEVSKDGSSNLGLKDQRLALEWVQENIAAFGGDPEKVVLWGESAGAISILQHTIMNGGDISYNGGQLFRGAIMNSGSTTPTVSVDHPKAQAIYDSVTLAAHCNGTEDSLACLRVLPFEQLSDAFASVPSFFSYTSIDLSYLPRPDPADGFLPVSPELAIQSGNYAKVPIIVGDQQDEGTLFSLVQGNLSTTDDVINYLTPIFPLASREQVVGLVDTYPDNPSSILDPIIPSMIYPQFARLSTILGDITFKFQRRAYLESIASLVPAWSYNADYLSSVPVLGTFHASDILAIFFNTPLIPTIERVLTYYISFVNHLDPNVIADGDGEEWPRYEVGEAGGRMVQFGFVEQEIIADTFGAEAYRYFKENQHIFRI